MMTGNALALVIMLLTAVGGSPASASNQRFKELYDYYFPVHSPYVSSFYRLGFDAVLSGSSPEAMARRDPLYRAARGDAAAFHSFVHNSARSGEGEFAEAWHYECLFLLLALGDDRFADLLSREDRETREVVGAAIDEQVNWTRHRFPKTRALYSYRFINETHQAMEGKHAGGVSGLLAAIARDKGFASARVYSSRQAGGKITVVVPNGISPDDRSALEKVVRRYLGDDGRVVTK